MRTHYDNLKVMRNAPPEVIRAAYKVLCQKYHPDKFQGGGSYADRVMKILNSAYAVLSDPDKKKGYDTFLASMEAIASEAPPRESAQQGQKPKQESWQETRRSYYEPNAQPGYNPGDWQSQASQNPPKPWPQIEDNLPLRRFFARSIDYFCGNLIVTCIVGLFAMFGLWRFETGKDLVNPLILSMTPSFVWMLLEAGIIKSFGNTPGKKLLGLRLVRNNQHSNHVKRAFAVWVKGMGLGLPVVSCLTAALAYASLKKNAQTSWDQDYGFAIEAEPMGHGREISATMAVLLSFSLLVAGHVAVNDWALRDTSLASGLTIRDGIPTATISPFEIQNPQPAVPTPSASECKPSPVSIDKLAKCAEQGDATAQTNLGKLYAEGQGVAKDNAKAFNWILKAALQGVASEQYHLALMYHEGKGIAKDDVLALYWLHEATKQGDANALYKLGSLYAEGKTVPQDYEEAAKWYRMAAEQGNAQAQYTIGLMYTEGRGVEVDYAAAYAWFSVAAKQGIKSAKQSLNYTGKLITAKQKTEAIKLAQNWEPKNPSPQVRWLYGK